MILNSRLVMYQLVSHDNDDYHFTIGREEGSGLFCNVNVPAHTILMTLPMHLVHNAVNVYSAEGVKGLCNLRKETTGSPHYRALCINHSASPNVSINTFGHLVSLKYLLNGDELFIDYTNTQCLTNDD